MKTSAAPDSPGVSCIMPTTARRRWTIPNAVRFFLAQDYRGPKELIVVSDGDGTIADRLPVHPEVRHVHLSGTRSLGQKRNEACALARYEYICVWDDDDWHGPARLRAQMAPLTTARYDLCLAHAPGFDWRTLVLTRYDRPIIATAVGKRALWRDVAYPDMAVQEDVHWLREHTRRGLNYAVLNRPPVYVVMRGHSDNTVQEPPLQAERPEENGLASLASTIGLEETLAFLDLYGVPRPDWLK